MEKEKIISEIDSALKPIKGLLSDVECEALVTYYSGEVLGKRRELEQELKLVEITGEIAGVRARLSEIAANLFEGILVEHPIELNTQDASPELLSERAFEFISLLESLTWRTHLGPILKFTLKSLSISQAKCGSELGLAQSEVSNACTGKSLKMEKLEKIKAWLLERLKAME